MQTSKKKKVLFAASEVYPFAKSGGLADVAASLPKALAKEFEINVILPFYGSIDVEKYCIVPLQLSYVIRMNQKNYEASLYGCSYAGITYYFVKSPCISEKEYFYGPPDQGYEDNAQRFTLFCRVIVELLKEDQAYSILHLNDWQTALAALLVKEDKNLQVKTVFTIHNMAYQGIFERSTLEKIGLSPHYFNMEALEFYGDINLMKAGIAYADRITTVSSEYAKEIQTKTFGCGLDGFLRHHQNKLQGILNGIDTEVFTPETDPFLVQHYSSENWKKKRENKKDYLKRSALKGINKPLFVFIGRFTWQKGIDLLIEALDKTAELNINISILGEGETAYHQKLEKIALQHSHIHLFFGYKEELSHQLYAAGDFLLMPSIFEPCGLNQMIAMRYGTVPIVHSVGGLKESVHPLKEFDPKSKKGFGIDFDESEAKALLQAIKVSASLFETSRYKKVSKHNMNCDFSWSSSAKKYVKLYHELEQ